MCVCHCEARLLICQKGTGKFPDLLFVFRVALLDSAQWSLQIVFHEQKLNGTLLFSGEIREVGDV